MNEFEKLIVDLESRREFNCTIGALVEVLLDTNPFGVYKLDAPYLGPLIDRMEDMGYFRTSKYTCEFTVVGTTAAMAIKTVSECSYSVAICHFCVYVYTYLKPFRYTFGCIFFSLF